MLFNSLQYALFFSLIVIIYFLLPEKLKRLFLLAASYFFYMYWNAKYALLLLLSTVITYFTALLIHKTKDLIVRKYCLLFCLVINLGILLLYKYFNFFSSTVADAFRLLGMGYKPVQLSLVLPVGISFYTFQVLGYIIDVYMEKIPPQRNFVKYALFVSFFPQLLAGPIGRADKLMPQFERLSRFDFERLKKGLLIIGRGLVKKLVIADRLAVLVNTVFDSPEKYRGIHFAVAAIFFSFQIYCDFSGYSDIAVGSAKILGYDLTENFKHPYLAFSVADFWKRWHISLTSWFRDYVYIPLGGNRRRHLLNILAVFLLSGLWHGASLTFVIWGLLNGLYQVIGIKLKPLREAFISKLGISKETTTYNWFRRLVTFALVSFAWIFFRAGSLGDLKLVLSRLFTINSSFFSDFNLFKLGLDKNDIIVSLISIVLLVKYELAGEKASVSAVLSREPLVARWLIYAAMITIIILFGVYGNANGSQFIYFKF